MSEGLTPTSVEARFNAAGLIGPATWLARVGVFVVVSVVALQERTDHHGVVVAATVALGILLAGWAGIDLTSRRGHDLPVWVLMAVLVLMGSTAGLVDALPVAIVAFALVAAIGAGSELPIGWACGVAATSILSIEISYLLFGFNVGDIGWPLAVCGCVVAGRQRRDARLLNAQAVALVTQAERTRAQEQRAATLDERARIAREIHDLLAHSLGALAIQIEAAQALLTDARDIDQASRLLEQARRLASSGLEETRRAIEALRADTPPLPESLRGLAEGHIAQYKVPVELTVTGAPRPLSPDANLALIRTTRESLANAAKHAPASPIAIALDYAPDHTTMTVTNKPSSGQQPHLATASTQGASGGYGLAGMRERLLLIGGILATGQSDTGWTVTAQVPL